MSVLSELDKLNEIGPALGWMRRSYSLTIEQVSAALGIECQHLRDMEAQTTSITATMVRRISSTLIDLQSRRVPLYCRHCRTFVLSVHSPAPTVPITCTECRANPPEPATLGGDVATTTQTVDLQPPYNSATN